MEKIKLRRKIKMGKNELTGKEIKAMERLKRENRNRIIRENFEEKRNLKDISGLLVLNHSPDF